MNIDDYETFTLTARKRPWQELTADPDAAVREAADTAGEVISHLLGELADRVLGRPAWGSQEWLALYHRGEQDPDYERERRREWHLTKLRIERSAGLDPTGDAINARANGASWQAIADVCGITRQAAHDRWAKHEHDLTASKEDRAMASEIVETDNGDGTKRVQQWDDNGELIFDMTADTDTEFNPMRGPSNVPHGRRR